MPSSVREIISVPDAAVGSVYIITMKIDFGNTTYIMGILNVTPDSFFDGGRYVTRQQAVDRAAQMIAEGADIIDVGGESSRPGADPVSGEEEMQRVCPVIEDISKRFDVMISVDTCKAPVAESALRCGAVIVNDISGMSFDSGMCPVVAASGCYVVLMHIKGTPKTMQQDPVYDNVVRDVYNDLKEKVDIALRGGVHRDKIIIDPGFGFGKTVDHNYELLANLEVFKGMGLPVLVGLSRKSMVKKLLGEGDDTLPGTLALNAISAVKGADIIRVHDVEVHKLSMKSVDIVKRFSVQNGSAA
ncbi:MAG TPA: dihydropteroate synthase [Spirochaetota bacterium]|nr:dihydropteroate synthase [Spirochaetota bacterium]